MEGTVGAYGRTGPPGTAGPKGEVGPPGRKPSYFQNSALS
jgi:hypothetical protein